MGNSENMGTLIGAVLLGLALLFLLFAPTSPRAKRKSTGDRYLEGFSKSVNQIDKGADPNELYLECLKNMWDDDNELDKSFDRGWLAGCVHRGAKKPEEN